MINSTSPADMPDEPLEPGDAVKITDGPFADFLGIIDDIDKKHDEVTVQISMFGREQPIRTNLSQVKRML